MLFSTGTSSSSSGVTGIVFIASFTSTSDIGSIITTADRLKILWIIAMMKGFASSVINGKCTIASIR